MPHRLLVTVSILLLTATADAVVPVEIPLQGMLRDNAGQPVADGAFAIEFSLYASAEDIAPVWSESWPPVAGDCLSEPTNCVQAQAGRFEVRLGTHMPMSTDLFATYGAMWLGVSIEGEPELPRRPMGSTPYARHAGSAASLACSGCVEAEHLSASLQEALASATITAADLPGDGLNEVSGGMMTTEFQHVLTSDLAVAIKDYNPLGVTSTITVPDIGVAMTLSVTIHVTNSDLTTLAVWLEDPAGSAHTLWNESGPGDVLHGTYPAPDPLLDGDLAAWVGQNPHGAWTLTAIDHGFDNLGTDGEIVSWSVTIETQSNQQAQVTGDLLVDGSVRIGPDSALCDASREGTVRYDAGAKRLYLCTGDEWIQLRGCSEACVPPDEASCGEAITNDCGHPCSGPGQGLNPAQCAAGLTSTPCGQAVTDDCGNGCGTTGTALDVNSCPDPAGLACGQVAEDACGNTCPGEITPCFETVTFTTCGETGSQGPSLAACNQHYTDTPLEGMVNVVGGIQYWTVPHSGSYRISASGAAGGSSTDHVSYPGRGARMAADFSLNEGMLLRILVGHQGQDGTNEGGGGGGTFVVHEDGQTPLIVAGGGGGACENYDHRSSGPLGGGGTDATMSESGQTAPYQQSGYPPGAGGTDGGGGAMTSGGCGTGGGGGLLGDGISGGGSTGGYAFVNGGQGTPKSTADGGDGGFGGGSGGNNLCLTSAGAGGGYSGGGGGGHNAGGGGGGSYNNGTNQANTAQATAAAGTVVITLAE